MRAALLLAAASAALLGCARPARPGESAARGGVWRPHGKLRLRPRLPLRGLRGGVGAGDAADGGASASASQPTAAWVDEDASDETLAAGALLMGCNSAGQLGRDDERERAPRTWGRPRASQAFQGRPVKLLAFGAQHTVAVVSDGVGEGVLTLGDNSNGQLGRPGAGGAAAAEGTPDWAAVRLGGAAGRRTWRHVACGHAHTALLDADGTLVVFGRNENGQLGLGNRQSAWDDFNATNLCAPVHWQHERRLRAPLERPPGPVAQVACGGEHTVLLLATGQVMAFGSNTHGQLGRHFDSLWAMREDTPLRVPVPPGEQVVQVACGDRHSVMLLGNGTALAFGCNALGQLGTGRDPLDTEAFAMFQLALAHQDMEGAQRLLHSTLRYAHLTRPLLPYK